MPPFYCYGCARHNVTPYLNITYALCISPPFLRYSLWVHWAHTVLTGYCALTELPRAGETSTMLLISGTDSLLERTPRRSKMVTKPLSSNRMVASRKDVLLILNFSLISLNSIQAPGKSLSQCISLRRYPKTCSRRGLTSGGPLIILSGEDSMWANFS